MFGRAWSGKDKRRPRDVWESVEWLRQEKTKRCLVERGVAKTREDQEMFGRAWSGKDKRRLRDLW